MTEDERKDIEAEANQLTYHYIHYSDLYRELTNEQWDELTKEIAGAVIGLIEQRVDQKRDEIEGVKEGRGSHESSSGL